MDIALALLQAGRALAAGYVLLMVFIVILAILLALIVALLIALIVRMGRSGRGETPAGAARTGSEPPRAAGEAPPTTAGAEETPLGEGGTVMEKPELPVVEGHIYRCPVEGCHCEISIELPPRNMPPTQPFVDCCGHEMVKVSVDASYGWGARGER